MNRKMCVSSRPSGSWVAVVLVAAMFFLGCVSAISIIRPRSENSDRIVGIHLGTTYSSVGVHESNRTKIIRNEQGKRTTPSWVAFSNNQTLIGEAAKDQATFNPERTVYLYHVTRLIGREFDDEEVQRAIESLPYKIVNIDGKPYIKIIMEDGEIQFFSPEEISALILVKMKKIAEAFVGTEIKEAVLTVPAYFNAAQRKATSNAGFIAGLNVVDIIDEPTAAAIGYGMDREGGAKNILVFDLGGATCDVTILAIKNSFYKVLAATRDQYLGGDDFINLIKEKHRMDIYNENRVLDKLRRGIEGAKTALSRFMQHQVHVGTESLFDGTNFSQSLTRVQFEELNSDLLWKTMVLVQKAMDDAGLQKNQIDEIALVGGSAGIPEVQQLLKDYFNRTELNEDVKFNVNPDEVVAYGATIRGEFVRGYEEFEVIDLLPAIPVSYGIETAGGVMTELIPIGTPDFTPIRRSRIFTTKHDQQTTVSIKVFLGEDRFTETKNYRLLGKFSLSGIPPAPKATPQIEVTFIIDVHDRLTVKAEDKGTGKAESIIIDYWPRDEEIDLEKGEDVGNEIRKLNDAFD